MKKFYFLSALAMIGIIALGFFLNHVNEVKDCKNYLIQIGNTYTSFRNSESEYLNAADKTSDYAQQEKQYANQLAGDTLYWVRFMNNHYEEDLINKCIQKLSITELQNLNNAFDYYEENIDFVYETYGTPTPQQ